MTSHVKQAKPQGLVHRGIYHERTLMTNIAGQREGAFARKWEEENIPRLHRALHPSCSRLEALMNKDDVFFPVSQETATAVATIVQWLGSPFGFYFLEEALKEAGYRVVPIE